jgi:hypothetical protein
VTPYAQRRPWGIDVFGEVSCDGCGRTRETSTSVLPVNELATLVLWCGECDLATAVEVVVAEVQTNHPGFPDRWGE